MRNLFNRLTTYARQSAAAFLVGLGIGGVLIGPSVNALVFPGQFAPRQFPTQQTHFARHVVTITATQFTVDGNIGCVFASSTCSVRIGALPYNAYIERAGYQPAVVCNAATTCVFSLGTASAGTQLINGADIKGAGTAGIAATVVAANRGIAATGNGITQTGADGGFDVFLTVTFTGAAPSTGTVVFWYEYFAPNDGGCAPVPMGSTATAC
jgi:hypothetical protein